MTPALVDGKAFWRQNGDSRLHHLMKCAMLYWRSMTVVAAWWAPACLSAGNHKFNMDTFAALAAPDNMIETEQKEHTHDKTHYICAGYFSK